MLLLINSRMTISATVQSSMLQPVDSKSDRDWKDRSNQRADIGDEAHDRAHGAPQQRAWYADDPETGSERHAVTDVYE